MVSTVFAKRNTKETPGVVAILLKHLENNLEEITYLLQIII